jgi:tetratricopeptide (TPR) repeat protein
VHFRQIGIDDLLIYSTLSSLTISNRQQEGDRDGQIYVELLAGKPPVAPGTRCRTRVERQWHLASFRGLGWRQRKSISHNPDVNISLTPLPLTFIIRLPVIPKLTVESLPMTTFVPVMARPGYRVCLCLFLFCSAPPTVVGEESWTGKTILLKKTGIPITNAGENGKQVIVGTLREISYHVIADKDGRLKVRYKGADGWFAKSDAVLQDDAVDFFTRILRADPKNTGALLNRAIAWKLKGKLDSAIEDLDEALRIEPNLSEAFFNRGNTWADKEEYVKALKDYDEAIRQNPKFAEAFIGRGVIWSDNLMKFDKALMDFDEAIGLDPRNAKAFNNRGEVWRKKSDFPKAINDYDEAIRMDPKFSIAFFNRGNVWCYQREFDKAIKDFDEAISLNPNDPASFSNRGGAWYAKKDYEKALKDFDEAIRLHPKSGLAHANRALVLAACPEAKYRNGKKAVESAQKACELSEWNNVMRIATLAAAYAEAGDFDEAVKYQKQALEFRSLSKPYLMAFQARLKLYEERKPYREE